MKKIDSRELYENLRDFLKSRGVSLEEGSYTKRIHQGCGVLAGAINATQDAMAKARVQVDKTVDAVRQTIHESTAPRSTAGSPPPKTSPGRPPAASAGRIRRKRSAAASRKKSSGRKN